MKNHVSVLVSPQLRRIPSHFVCLTVKLRRCLTFPWSCSTVETCSRTWWIEDCGGSSFPHRSVGKNQSAHSQSYFWPPPIFLPSLLFEEFLPSNFMNAFEKGKKMKQMMNMNDRGMARRWRSLFDNCIITSPHFSIALL